MHDDNRPLLATVREACRELRIGRSTINRLFRDGQLPRRKIGRKTLVAWADLKEFAAGQRGAA